MNTIKPYTAEADIEGHRFVAFGATEGGVKQAAAGNTVIGVTGFVGALANRTVDVEHGVLAEVQLADTVAQGDELAVGTDGKAVKAAPATTVSVLKTDETPVTVTIPGDTVVAVALEAGAADAVISVRIK